MQKLVKAFCHSDKTALNFVMLGRASSKRYPSSIVGAHSREMTWQSWHDRAEAYHRLLASWPLFSHLADRLIDLLPHPIQGPLIDLAAGTGLVAERVLDRYPQAQVQLVEPAQAMLTLARQRLGTRVTRYVQSAAETVGQLSVQADAVVCNAALHLPGRKSCPQRLDALSETRRLVCLQCLVAFVGLNSRSRLYVGLEAARRRGVDHLG